MHVSLLIVFSPKYQDSTDVLNISVDIAGLICCVGNMPQEFETLQSARIYLE
jgi:hypothetical protein